MKVKYYLKNTKDIIIPSRANETDAGYDVTATSGPKVVYANPKADGHVGRIDYVEYETNLYFVPETKSPIYTESAFNSDNYTNFHTDLRPRSSISSKTNFVLANSIGLIDRGYHNQVLVRFKYIWQPEDLKLVGIEPFTQIVGNYDLRRMYSKGDKIAQLLPVQTHDIEFHRVDDLPGENRGGGFGSTDEKKV
jgi:dUTPase